MARVESMSSSTNDVAVLLQEAVGLHRQNKLDAALALYQRALTLDPHHFDALHLSGVIARQLGDPARAVDLIGRAIQIRPDLATAHCNLGAALHDLGRVDESLASYDRAIALKPDYALAICNRGNTLRSLGRQEEAARCYQTALAIDPAYPEAHCHLAILLQDAGQPEAALESADRALRARPRYAQAHAVRADALQSLQRFAEAVRSYDTSIEIDPKRAQTWLSRGTVLQRLKRFDEAVDSYDRAIALQPQYPLAHEYRGNSLRALQRKDEAIAAYQLALDQGAEPGEISYALASLGVGAAPAQPPGDHVKSLFDQYADHFDRHLVENLRYQVPALLDAAIRRHLVSERMDTLDIGCGTGLCAPYLRAHSRTLGGIDLSQKMLDRARELGLYDELACRELTSFLSESVQRYDLIVAADVFVYIGDLADVFTQASRALRAGGLFCFTVEAGSSQDFTLAPSQRYTHSIDYVRRLALGAGLRVLEAEKHIGRYEGDVPVPVFVVVAAKPRASR
jgi:predicted TPR repeat methyltransferase